MYFDTHAHYDSRAFDRDRDEVLASLPLAGVELALNPGCELESSREAVEYARRFPHMYAAVGFHPSDVEKMDEAALQELEALAKDPKVKAIGEIGLDYYWEDYADRSVQNEGLDRQMELAKKLALPVIFHDREAHADSMAAVRRHPGVTGVFHCYSGSV
ncbi:MAG: TatD family hydrolase, partial [Oscillospiraceae bacterium]|nr:TatD family hydrolase [Oscillospiraceae bacterium]